MRTHNFIRAALTFSFFALSSCAAGSSDDDTPAQIASLFVNDSEITVGETTRLNADFTFANEAVFDDDEKVSIVIRLPDGVGYQQESAEIAGSFSDREVSPSLVLCADGGAIVVVDLDDSDLKNADNPHGGGDARLKLTVLGLNSGHHVIKAWAGYRMVFPNCDSTSGSENWTQLMVTR